MGVAERRGFEPFVSQQIHYTPQAREAEFELLPAGLDQGLGTLVWSPIAGGLLSGKYRRGQDGPEGTRHVGDWDEPPVHDPDALYDLIDVLVEVGDAHGVSAAQVTLAWLLTRPAVTSLIVGARTEEQLGDNLAAASLELSADEVERIDAASRAAPALPAVAPGGERVGSAERGRPGVPGAAPGRPSGPRPAASRSASRLSRRTWASRARRRSSSVSGSIAGHLGGAALVVQGDHRDVGGGGVLDRAGAHVLLLDAHADLHRASARRRSPWRGR